MKLKSKILSFLLLFFVVFVTLSATNIKTLALTKPNTLIIHYYRYNSDYNDNWNFWIWQKEPTDGSGSSYQFDKIDNNIVTDDFGAVATIDLTTDNLKNSTKLGIIIRKGDWLMKDIDMDRFIDLQNTEDGITHCYLVEGDERIGNSKDDPNGPDRTDKIRYALFTNEKEIEFGLTSSVVSDKVNLLVNNTVSNDCKIEINNNTGKIILNDKLDFANTYELAIDFSSGRKTYTITYDGIYDTIAFEKEFTYDGDDLGATTSKNKTVFKLWAPISTDVKLNLYATGTPKRLGGSDEILEQISMVKEKNGVWTATVNKNLHATYYTYVVTNGTKENEVIDPYAKSAGVNGIRGMIVDFNKINPKGFKYNNRCNNITNATDAIIYELHVRDLTSHSSWDGPEEYRGKFLGLTVEGTKYNGVTTGLDHIKELGVTHVQLVPIFDHGIIDEAKAPNTFNWGYMPLNFNVPEGSYSTDPFNGETRLIELKQTSMALNKNNLGLIMDVVYNHTGQSADSNLNLIVPGYYYRFNKDGSFSNGSGCGNETASERSMMRKFIVDSVKFWAYEYNISGFRFDLMALHDTETMTEVYNALKEIDDKILVYGEPWNGGTTTIDSSIACTKDNLKNASLVGAFNDEIRDGIKGSVFDAAGKGFIQGNISEDMINKVKYGIVGGINHEGVTSKGLSYDMIWHTSPLKTINYVSAHDNNTLYDKLMLSTTSKQKEYILDMQTQANAIVLTSQGIPFLHAGVEFMRSKPTSTGYDSNSYQSPDSVNQLRWDLKANKKNMSCFNYYKDLIALRKSHPAFRMTTAEDIQNNLNFIYTDKEGIIAYEIKNFANNDTWENILVIHASPVHQLTRLTLPEGEWNLVGRSLKISSDPLKTYQGGTEISIFGNETLILYSGMKSPKKVGCKTNSSLYIIPLFIGCSLLLFKKKRNLIN